MQLWEPSIRVLVFPPSLEAQSPSRRTSVPLACTSSPCSRPPKKFQWLKIEERLRYHPSVVAWVSWDSIALQLEAGLHQVERVHQQNLHTSCDQEGQDKQNVQQEWQLNSAAGDTIGTLSFALFVCLLCNLEQVL